MDIDRLEGLAKAALDGNCWHSWEVMADDGYDVDDAKFIGEANPQTIRAMIELLREMGDALEKLSDECEAEFTTDGYWNLDGALVTRKTVKNATKVLAKYKEMTK